LASLKKAKRATCRASGNAYGNTGCPKIRETTQWGNINSGYKIMREILNKYILYLLDLKISHIPYQKVQL
jgi:hypothetical protein